jgi:hypothetical protein
MFRVVAGGVKRREPTRCRHLRFWAGTGTGGTLVWLSNPVRRYFLSPTTRGDIGWC